MKQFIICPDCGSIELAQIESRVPARWDFYRCTKCKQLIPGDERWLAKAISIKQPWAYLIASGIKDVENRTWKTNFRGRVLIHCGAKRVIEPFAKSLYTTDQQHAINDFYTLRQNETTISAIIGSVEIIDCVVNHESIWAEKTPMAYLGKLTIECQPPIYNWVLKDPVLFEKPILNVKGHLSFFTPILP